MNNSRKSSKAESVLLLLCSLTAAIVASACKDAPLPLVAPALSINISADDIPNSTKQDATMSIYTCNNQYATCSSATILTATLPVGIEIRGESSKFVSKKNYGIEIRNIHGFDRDYPLLGMPTESDWVLYGGAYDPSMLTNGVAFEIYRSIFGRYAPRTRYVNLYLQDEYRGLYAITEKIKIGTDRVDIRQLSSNDRFGTAVTGGYIFALDKSSDGDENKFTSDTGTIVKVQIPNSDDIITEQLNYLKQYFNDLESAIDAATTIEELATWVDIGSLVDFILIHELTFNGDSYFSSAHFQKKYNDQVVYFGPLWDFDRSFGMDDRSVRDLSTQALRLSTQINQRGDTINIWNLLWQHEFVREAVATRWRALRENAITVDTVNGYFDEQVDLMIGMQHRDFSRWGRSNGHFYLQNFKPQSHPHMIEYMKDFVMGQIEWLDECFSIENERNYCS